MERPNLKLHPEIVMASLRGGVQLPVLLVVIAVLGCGKEYECIVYYLTIFRVSIMVQADFY